ncbi:glycogen phosphorylase [Streptomyces rubellomurinus subsp. indigoferus]|uniref:glycogen phosphorylase n=1 Tax=Streptomyces rubellomurinus (strain ATCC 31215) TaxID=359131 RepID=A0A0F2THX3_STRR3|nr:alpha-glucan family phosphorylase [Streptomyces rubellomurinus]KJS52896.1 glycogen phosphorylase [Streptomyces rubellomurinus subsp. indigoferus]KJS62096.1 glycogen phosphorylase [Streptomyces rubellomurinus]
MKAIRRFTVRTVLPEQLQPLHELALNLRWSWHPETRDLFRSVDPEVWAATGEDPVRLLGEVPAARLAALAADRRFLRRLGDLADDLQEYLTGPRWYQSRAEDGPTPPPAAIAYFSPEYGIAAALPQYSGGLGILAGDHLKAASDLGVPLIGVGLFYRHGYFRQSLNRDGWQQERYPLLDPDELAVSLLREPDGTPSRVDLALPGGRTLAARIWKAQVGRVPLLLLDSDIEANSPAERDVTDRLYGGGSEHRLLQEMLLGIGGVRAVRAYCRLTGHPAPEVFHTNEGHAGFLGIERIRELVADRCADRCAEQSADRAAGREAEAAGRDAEGPDFAAALEAVRAGTLFTTHTPVPAGIDRFDRELVARHFGGDAALPGVPADQVLALGAETWPGGDPKLFNMAAMGLRLAQRANGVSTLHGEVSRAMFNGLWPGFDAAEVPITSVTNGVHAATWIDPAVVRLGAAEIGADRAEEAMTTGETRRWTGLERIGNTEIWDLRRSLRAQLVDEARHRLRASWRQRGAGEAELGWVSSVLDPDVLTIGFARRVPSYKRLTLMLRDPDRLRGLLLHPTRPVQIVVAGKAHPADDGGKRLIQQMVAFADDPAVRHRIVFLPDYDMDMARHLYPGCDVWLNNPLRPLEACGTSGMKAALNGCLNLSVLDGWWDEWYDGQNGWAIPTADEGAGVLDPDSGEAERRDDIEAAALYDLIEEQVAARFYDRAGDGLPHRWIAMVRHTLVTLGPKVLAGRMVREYVDRLYAPAALAQRELAAGGHRGARELAAWKAKVRAAWPAVRVEHVQAEGPGEAQELGSALELRVQVALGALEPGDVEVQAVSGRVDETDGISDAAVLALKPVGGPDLDGRTRYEGSLELARTGPFGYTVRVLPAHPRLASPAELGLVALPAESAGMDAGLLR